MSEFVIEKHKKYGKKFPHNGNHYGGKFECPHCRGDIHLSKEQMTEGTTIQHASCGSRYKIYNLRGFDANSITVEIERLRND